MILINIYKHHIQYHADKYFSCLLLEIIEDDGVMMFCFRQPLKI